MYFTAYATNTNVPIETHFHLSDEDSADPPSDKDDLDTRALIWPPIEWDIVDPWFDNVVYKSPDISSLLQSVVDREGWSSGNNVMSVIKTQEAEIDVSYDRSISESELIPTDPDLNRSIAYMDFVLDSNDLPHFIYVETAASGSAVYYNYRDKYGWNTPINILDSSYDTTHSFTSMQICLDSSDNPHIFVSMYSGSAYYGGYLVHVYRVGSIWYNERLSPANYYHIHRVRVLFGDDGLFHVLWGWHGLSNSPSGKVKSLWYSKGNTGSWTHTALYTPTSTYNTKNNNCSIAKDEDGYIYCFYPKIPVYGSSSPSSTEGLYYKTNKDGFSQHKINPTDFIYKWFPTGCDAIIDGNGNPLILGIGSWYGADARCGVWMTGNSEVRSLVRKSSGTFIRNEWDYRCITSTELSNSLYRAVPKVRRSGSTYYYTYSRKGGYLYLGTMSSGFDEDSNEIYLGRLGRSYTKSNRHEMRIDSTDKLHIIRADNYYSDHGGFVKYYYHTNRTGTKSVSVSRFWSAIEHRHGLEKACLRVHWREPTQIQTPLISPTEEFRLDTTTVTISTYPTDANIYYTLDGSTPTESSILYTGPFEISSSTTVKAKAYKQYWLDSDVATRSYSFIFITIGTHVQLTSRNGSTDGVMGYYDNKVYYLVGSDVWAPKGMFIFGVDMDTGVQTLDTIVNNDGRTVDLYIDSGGYKHAAFADNKQYITYATNKSGSWVSEYTGYSIYNAYNGVLVVNGGDVHMFFTGRVGGTQEFYHITNQGGSWQKEVLKSPASEYRITYGGLVGSTFTLAVDVSGNQTIFEGSLGSWSETILPYSDGAIAAHAIDVNNDHQFFFAKYGAPYSVRYLYRVYKSGGSWTRTYETEFPSSMTGVYRFQGAYIDSNDKYHIMVLGAGGGYYNIGWYVRNDEGVWKFTSIMNEEADKKTQQIAHRAMYYDESRGRVFSAYRIPPYPTYGYYAVKIDK